MCAAVADYTPISVSKEKIKKKEDTLIVELKKTKDILKHLGELKNDNQILFAMVGKYFKNLLTLSSDNYYLTHSKMDDVDMARSRTADLTYADYENKSGFNFSTYREITVSEKNKLDIRLNFKQYEFNKELSVSFNIPKNYIKK